MTSIVVNCQKTAFGQALGVPHFLLQVCRQLKKSYDVILAVEAPESFKSDPGNQSALEIADSVISIGEARVKYRGPGSQAVELLPHHFQASRICQKSIMICHDLHVFDIPWKYPNAKRQQQQFRDNLLSATVVMTHFPRTYYGVEHIAGTSLRSLFLTPSPLMIDTTFRSIDSARKNGPKLLLYPAQLQKHKNHTPLIRAARSAVEQGRNFKLRFTGSDFDPAYTAQLRDFADECDLSETVTFAGRVSVQKLIRTYHACDGVIIPSLAEGGAYVALEAIAAGKPVAVNAIESARMHLNAYRASVLWFDAADEKSMLSSLLTLLDIDQAQCFEDNTTARKLIQDSTWNRVGKLWRSVIDALVKGETLPRMRVSADGAELKYS